MKDGYAETAERLELAEARVKALSTALVKLVAYVQRVGGYIAPEDQIALWQAEAVLAEVVNK